MLKTFANQNKLLRLPIPLLEYSIQRYLQSVEPLQTSEEHEKTKLYANDFKEGLGKELQARLESHDKKQPISWLEDWWLRMAYHTYREPLVLNSNWFLCFKNPTNAPQIPRAAGLLWNMLNVKERIEREEIPAEVSKKGPLCMNQYREMFGVMRLPMEGCDTIVKSKSQHILVLAKNQIYSLNVYDERWKRISLKDLENALARIVERSQKDKSPPICLLTAAHRDVWTNARQHLLNIHPTNVESFRKIDTCLFALSLDDYVQSNEPSLQHQQIFHGKGKNRWFDSCLSLIVASNGFAGFNGEHSPLDALIPSFIGHDIVTNEPAKDAIVEHGKASDPIHLNFVSDYHTEKWIRDTSDATSAHIGNSDSCVHLFTGFGAEFIKTLKFSPDSFVQMILQLTFYRIHKTVTAVYETASTRHYLHGRTETCRSLSAESKKLCFMFFNSDVSSYAKHAQFVNAVKAHGATMKAASFGEGFDRHLLGLRMCLKKGETHPFLKDPVFAQSTMFKLSTSMIQYLQTMSGSGFGAGCEDGYGVNYMVGPDSIRFGVECKRSGKNTSTQVFIKELEATLLKVKSIMSEKHPKL